MSDITPSAEATAVAHRRLGPAAWIVCPALGVALGWMLPRVVPWLNDLAWLPFDGPLELVESLPEPHVTIGAMIVGGIGGLLLAALVVADLVTVTVQADRARITRGDHTHTVLRSAVGAVFMDGERLVVVDGRGAEMVRETTDLPVAELRDAFLAHGFRWSARDPYAETYRPWADGDPDLPTGADRLLRLRAEARRAGERERADELHLELGRIGVIVRDRGSTQTWRPVDDASPTGRPHR